MYDYMAQGHTWSPAQLGIYVEEVREDRLLALWLLIATTGLSLTTVTTLARDEVDLHEHQLCPRPRPASLGHENQRSRYSLDPDAYDALKDHVIAWDKAQDERPSRSGRLFVDDAGRCLSPARVTSLFRRHCAQANLRAVPFREVRRAYLIAALETGIPTRVLRERLDLGSPSLGVGIQPISRRRQMVERTEQSERTNRRPEMTRHLRSIR